MINLFTKTKVIAYIVILAAGGLGFYFINQQEKPVDDEAASDEFHRHTVVSNGPECAIIGMKILTEHSGTAIDAAIATLFCEGVTICQSMGLGGGFFATIYHKASGQVDTLIARERAPSAATENMYENMTKVNGILSAAVPGELKGYAEMHKKYGRVPWKTLIQPTIDLCRSGHLVTEYLGRVIKMMRKEILAEPSLREMFVDPATNDVWKSGDRIRRPDLARTLEIIAEEGVDTMYTTNGTIAKLLVKDIQEAGGIITIEDLVNYRTEWKLPITTHLKGGYTVHSAPLPASGMVLALILNIMNGFEPKYSVDFFHQMIESFKYGYAKRTLFGDKPFDESFINQFSDMKYADSLREKIDINRTFNDPRHYGAEYDLKEDHGTAQISVLAANGDAISITSSINGIFGSLVRSKSTGIILNNQMDDFSSPGKTNDFGFRPSPANFIKPEKRPLSSMSPNIILNQNGDVVFVSGSAGGSKITTVVSYVFTRHFWLNETLKAAISAKRLHHQVLPMEVSYEEGYDNEILDGLRRKGHNLTTDHGVLGFAAITAISRAKGYVEAVFDPRRFGSIEIH